MPRLKGISFETAIIERYRRRESSVEEALIEMYLAGVSVRRVEDITEALWGSKVSASTISELNKKAYVNIEAWRNRPLQGGKYPYVYVDGIYLKRNWGGEYENVAVLVAIAVNKDAAIDNNIGSRHKFNAFPSREYNCFGNLFCRSKPTHWLPFNKLFHCQFGIFSRIHSALEGRRIYRSRANTVYPDSISHVFSSY